MKLTIEESKVIVQQLKGRKSVEEFARELGIAHKTVDNWQRGLYTPSPICQRLLREYAEKNGIEFPDLSVLTPTPK